MLNGFRANSELAIAEKRQKDIAPYLVGNRPWHVLDLANGRLRPQYILLKVAGHQVYGIDLLNRSRSSLVETAYRLARWLYVWKLGLTVENLANQTLVCGNVDALPFSDNSFDLTTSVAAFEHLLDVPAAVAELHRVMRPGGLIWVVIHLFASLSGGHNISATQIPLRSVPSGVDPWDHLRKRRLQINVPLNEWLRDEYLETFAHYFEILSHYCGTREGQELLTPSLEAELSTYNRDELTCRSYIILARKGP